ncbi:MAG: glycosyltransferase [Crocinitomicaceae bacterium]|nr:glycosyltransferase [Crocinitomicaceae bacterium]
MKQTEISIIIVNYKNPKLIQQCVASILEFETELDFEIIVVDNHSEDESYAQLIQVFPEIIWIQCDYNSGFGRANNLGLEHASGKYILFLNSDVVLKAPNTLGTCLSRLKSLKNHEQYVLGTNLVNEDGSYQETLRLNFPGIGRELNSNPLYILLFHRILRRNKQQKKAEQQREAHKTETFPNWINGAFLLSSKNQLETKKLQFDPDFFLYGEDMEWAWRVNKAGMRFYHYPNSELIHIGSASMPNEFLKRSQIVVSDWLFHRKTRGKLYLSLILSIVLKNLVFNDILHFLARLRQKNMTEYTLQEKKFRRVHKYLLRKYGFKLLFKKTLSLEKSFFTNCYEDKTLLEKSN